MTAYRFVTLTCDTCGSIWDDGCARTVAAARRSSRPEGWVPDGRHGDRCGVCVGTHTYMGGSVHLKEPPVPVLSREPRAYQ